MVFPVKPNQGVFKMARRKPKRRQHKIIAFKAYQDTDQDILDWWESIEAGERSDMLRDVIRAYLGLPAKMRRTKSVLDLPELIEVRRDTLWIKDTLNDMPAYLERIIQHVAHHTPARASPEPVRQEPMLGDVDSKRRSNRMKKATW